MLARALPLAFLLFCARTAHCADCIENERIMISSCIGATDPNADTCGSIICQWCPKAVVGQTHGMCFSKGIECSTEEGGFVGKYTVKKDSCPDYGDAIYIGTTTTTAAPSTEPNHDGHEHHDHGDPGDHTHADNTPSPSTNGATNGNGVYNKNGTANEVPPAIMQLVSTTKKAGKPAQGDADSALAQQALQVPLLLALSAIFFWFH